MVRLFYVLGMCAMLAASGVFGLWLGERGRADARLEEARSRPGAVHVFRAQVGESGTRRAEVSPLVAQAAVFASYLNPAKDPEKPSSLVLAAGSAPVVPAVRPAAPSVRFRLCGTSYYPNEPGRSMALISEVGSLEGNERWVKEGTQVGHFVIHEIRKGMIVYRDGEQLREMAVEHGASVPNLVRDARLGSRPVSNAADGNEAGALGGN